MGRKRNRSINRDLHQDGIQMMGRCLVYNINSPLVTLADLPEAVRVQVRDKRTENQSAYMQTLGMVQSLLPTLHRLTRRLAHSSGARTKVYDPVFVEALIFQTENLTALVKRLLPHQEVCEDRNKI